MYILLDIDGVLNKKDQWSRVGELDKDCMDNFAKAFSEMRPKILLTSSWRHGFVSRDNPLNSPQIKKLEFELKKRGLMLSGILRYDKDRSEAVNDFIKAHPDSLILDDDPSEFKKKIDNLYLVNCKDGFSEKDIKAVRRKTKCF